MQNCEQKPGIRLNPRQIGKPTAAYNAGLEAVLHPALEATAQNAK